MPLDEAEAVRRSMAGYQLQAGAPMTEEDVDAVSILTDTHAERIATWAAEMADDWRAAGYAAGDPGVRIRGQ